MRNLREICVCTAMALFAAPMTWANAQPATDDACSSLVPAAMGGPTLPDKNKIVLRWLSTSNYELTFRGKVYLLDAYFLQGPRSRRLFRPARGAVQLWRDRANGLQSPHPQSASRHRHRERTHR